MIMFQAYQLAEKTFNEIPILDIWMAKTFAP